MQHNEQSNGLNGKKQLVRPQVVHPIIRVERFTKNYYMGRTVVPALRGVNLTVQQGEFVALMGPSGSGKSTFMNLLGCLDRPTSGSYLLDGMPVSKMNSNQLADIRNQKIGFVFQSFNLLSWMTALDNVELPLVYAGMARAERKHRAQQALSIVGLKSRASHRPVEMSGGQQQRVAIARALVTSPSLFLADEPTGNLDSQTSEQIIGILQELNARGLTVILVTHEPDIARYAHRQVKFRDGRIIEDTATIIRIDPTVGTDLSRPPSLTTIAPVGTDLSRPPDLSRPHPDGIHTTSLDEYTHGRDKSVDSDVGTDLSRPPSNDIHPTWDEYGRDTSPGPIVGTDLSRPPSNDMQPTWDEYGRDKSVPTEEKQVS
ncbi:MAG TPA: ABC transporter ATP-binding protein [Ktedonobacteraceae bacterium]|nr:ABC transporter ATP-binding protein [Ktedonobacteraceae bacterium]